MSEYSKVSKFYPRSNEDRDLNIFLSKFWYCTNDRTRLLPYTSRYDNSPYFYVRKENMQIVLNNASSMRKINDESIPEIINDLNEIFLNDPGIIEVPLVGVYCPTCNKRSAAPRIKNVNDLGKNIGRALFDKHRLLETRNHGRFRFVDHFGLARDNQNNSSGGRLLLFGLLFGIQIIVLYYLFGLEMKFRNRWIPLGPILIIFGLIFVVILLFNGFFRSFTFFRR